MARSSIPVDLRNPGQVFACLGLMEAAQLLLGRATGSFDWNAAGQARFHVESPGEAEPVRAVLDFVARAEVSSVAPVGSGNEEALATEKWQVPTRRAVGEEFPYARPGTPATLPAVLEDAGGIELPVNHWGDSTERDAVKLWAGSGGYPGAALLRDGLDLVRNKLQGQDWSHDPFSMAVPQSSAFRFDWRRDYIPVEVGFSPNQHGAVVMVGFPLVELLAAVGLTHARPKRGATKLQYSYAVLGTETADTATLPLVFHRAALGGAELPFPQRFFQMRLGWPGQEGQARCILEVREEIR